MPQILTWPKKALAAVATLMVMLGAPGFSVCNAESPNVIVIYSDDQGALDARCFGSEDLETPNIDGLARSGIRLTSMYAPSAICSASRAGLMTGRLPPRAGVPGNVSSQEGRPGMPTEEVTLAEMFKAAGYATGHVGKWHLGYTPETMPNGQGFDFSFGHMGGCIDNYSHFFYWQGPNRHDLWRNGKEVFHDGEYFGDLMVQECQNFIKAHRDHPFFLYWAINWPHYPLQGTSKWRERYRELPHPRDKYATFISSMDELIGDVVSELEALGLRDNTLIVFQSDHGHSVEERAFFGGGNPGPYRGAKGCLFEGGLRVPSVVSWPAVLPQGESRDQFAVGCDWLPTLAALTGCKLPERYLDGKDLSDVLESKDAKSPHDDWYWQLGMGPNAQWAVRLGEWKLLGNPRDPRPDRPAGKLGSPFLVNLNEDPGELSNVASEADDKLQQLLKVRQRWQETLE
ncbi:MAG: sulfatase-like hydrolase/transferase [Planctomycetota bacterium]|nr:sulfatase-like hydrolase/transferase [Planctomycetota bacterium]